MMRQMRENTKWIMLITALAFVALMVFEWGMDMSGASSASVTGGEIGRVNGEPITGQEYNLVYQNLQQQQMAMSDAPLTASIMRQIEEAAWEQLVMQRLIQQELRRRGIDVTPAEIRQAARFSPPPEILQSDMFMVDGQFDLARYHEFLASPMADDQMLMQLEAYYRDAIPRSKLFFQATAGIYLSDAELWRAYRDQHETATVRYLSIDPAGIVADDELSVSDAEIRSFYRANQEQFRREAQATVRYVSFDRTPQAADSAAALQRAIAIRDEIRDGADFGDVARRESADPGSAPLGGELAITRGQTVPAFDEAAFSQPVGVVGDPVLTEFGYHVIRVDTREADVANVRHVLIPVTLTRDNEDRLLEQADSLERLGERYDLDRAAAELGLTVQTGQISEGFPFLADVGAADDGMAWAFDEADVGEVSPVFESDFRFYMMELTAQQPAGVVSLQEATPQIRNVLLGRKRVEAAQARVREQLRAGPATNALERVAAAFSAEIRDAGPFTRGDFVPGLGRTNAAIGAAFGLQPGQLSDAIAANNQVHVVQLVERQEADRAAWEEQRDEQRQQLTPAVAEQRWQLFLSALRDDADIVDNRAAVRRAAAQQGPLAGF
jgi:peptidyl-prolyl cis-trans isomerase D